jgi:hypothetical protein
VHEGADILAVFVVLASNKPILLQRCFAIGLRLSLRQIDCRPGDGVRQLLDRDVLVIAHSHLGHQPSNLLGPLTQRAALR